MKVDLKAPNPALISIFDKPEQIITLDTNFLIPPDRSKFGVRKFDFMKFREIWLDPIFKHFPYLAIHESVYLELVSQAAKDYIRQIREKESSTLIIHEDASLTETEKIIRDSIESRIVPFTRYEPLIDNKDDRGEVKSLAYIAAKNLIYFAAHDNNVILLVEKSQEWSTGLDDLKIIKMYELIYYLLKKGIGNNSSLRHLYKYQYHLTEYEKKSNSGWGKFIEGMNDLYINYC